MYESFRARSALLPDWHHDFASLSEGLDAGDRDGVERLDESDHEVHGTVEVGAIDNSVVGVGRAGRDKDRGDRNAAIVELDGAGIIAEAGNEIELQGDVLVGSNLFDMRDEVAVGKFAEGIEHHAWAASQNLLRRFRARPGDVIGYANFQAEADIGIDDARGGSRAAHLDAAFFLDGADVEDLVGMRRLDEAAHDFEHHSAAHTVIPSFREIAVVGEHGEIRDGCDGIARGNAQGLNFSGGARASVQEKLLLLRMALRIVRGDVRVPNVSDGKNRALGAEDHPTLVGKR